MGNYIKNKDLLAEIILCKDSSLAYTNELIDMFFKISEKLSHSFHYKNPEDKKDCIIVGVEDAFKYFHRFDSKKSKNAFAYITQIVKNGMAKSYRQIYPQIFKGFKNISLNNVYSL